MSQKARVLAALRSRGTRGVTAVDFAAGRVVDGGKPIMRVAARVLELRQDGHEIVVEGERDSCAIYRLLRDTQDTPEPPRAPSPAESLSGITVTGTGRLAIFDDDWEDAA